MTTGRHFKVREVLTPSYVGEVIVNSTIDHFLQSGGIPDNLLRENSCAIKSSDSSCSALVAMYNPHRDSSSQKVFVKKFLFKGRIHSLKSFFYQHRAQIMWKVSWHLLRHSVSVPLPEGYLLKKRGPICSEGYFFSKAVGTCPSLDELTKDSEQLNKRLSSGGLNRVLAHCVAAMHDSGTTHGDLKWKNILVDADENQLWLTDLDASKIYREHLGPKRVARDLARFVLSGLEAGVGGTTLAVFLNHYARHRNLNLNDIEGPMMKDLQKLRKRHEKKLRM
jgi:RIO kinase 1